MDLIQFAHGAGRRDKIHFLLDDGSLRWCAHEVVIEPDGFGSGLAAIHERGGAVCKHCCKRVASSPDLIADRLRLEE